MTFKQCFHLHSFEKLFSRLTNRNNFQLLAKFLTLHISYCVAASFWSIFELSETKFCIKIILDIKKLVMSPKHKIKRKQTKLSKEQLIQIQQKLKEDILTIKEIAIEYGIAKSSVYRIMNKQLSVEQRISKTMIQKVKNQELDKQLFEWYQNQKEPENTTYKQLLEKAKEIKNNIGASVNLTSLHNWLKGFIKHHEIQLKFEIYSFGYKKLEIELINWLLLEIISGRTVLNKILKNKTLELMELDGPLKSHAKKIWLHKFKKCHKILIEFAMLENRIEKYDETIQFNKNLDDQLLNWLLERKKLGDTISLEMFADQALKLMNEFDESSLETEEKSWPCRIKNRYNLPKYRKMFQIFQKDDEANQSNVEKIEEEENSTAESHKLKKLKNVKFCDTLPDDIDSLSGEIIEDIDESIVEAMVTARVKSPDFDEILFDIPEYPDFPTE